jgi:hypothetical protein
LIIALPADDHVRANRSATNPAIDALEREAPSTRPLVFLVSYDDVMSFHRLTAMFIPLADGAFRETIRRIGADRWPLVRLGKPVLEAMMRPSGAKVDTSSRGSFGAKARTVQTNGAHVAAANECVQRIVSTRPARRTCEGNRCRGSVRAVRASRCDLVRAEEESARVSAHVAL